MKNPHFAFVNGWFFLATLFSPLTMAQETAAGDPACQAFESSRANYHESLDKDASGKPMASEQSVQLAWTLTGAAEDCLSERAVAFERISTYALRITPNADVEPGQTAALLEDLTSGAVIYDVGFFLRKPFAAGGFEQNILFLPHSAVLGKIDMVTRHEFNHARAHSLLLDDDKRLRHLWIFAEDTMFVDEVLAYADGGINAANAERMRSWSLDMAHQYIAATRELIEAAQPEVAMTRDGQRCPMTPTLRKEISVMLSCIEGVLQSDDTQPAEIALCDGQRADAAMCAP